MSRWNEIISTFGYDGIVSVPCKKISNIYSAISKEQVIIVPREDDAINFAIGASLSNRKYLVVIQSSGFGNILNSMASLAIPYSINIDVLISCRGGVNEDNPVQRIMGQLSLTVPKLLKVNYQKESEYNSLSEMFLKRKNDKINIMLIGV